MLFDIFLGQFWGVFGRRFGDFLETLGFYDFCNPSVAKPWLLQVRECQCSYFLGVSGGYWLSGHQNWLSGHQNFFSGSSNWLSGYHKWLSGQQQQGGQGS